MRKQAIAIANPIFNAADGSSIFKKFSYSGAVRAGEFLYIAGQIGLNFDGTIPEDDETQFRNCFERMKIVVEEAGAALDDIVELVSYHVGLQKDGHLASFKAIKDEYIVEPFPTWTILGIECLAREGLVIEVKAVAYVPNK